jgi:DNA-binding response OmpR family regulator
VRAAPHRATKCDDAVTHRLQGPRSFYTVGMSKPLILMVDDDAELAEDVAELLFREGWALHHVLTGGDGEKALDRLQPDLLLLDVMLPDAHGLDLCRRWRDRFPALGIVMLTARGDPMDRVLGLEIGADDYLPKPFEPRELVARVRALLRRQAPGRVQTQLLRFDGLVIDPLQREVRAGDALVALSTVEFKLLLALARSAGQPLDRDQLNAAVQGGPYRPLDRTVDVQVARLRRKLADAAPGREWVATVRGEGYVFLPKG